MRVLMFGWEFPPHIAGGLGTACEGIVKGLAYNGDAVRFRRRRPVSHNHHQCE